MGFGSYFKGEKKKKKKEGNKQFTAAPVFVQPTVAPKGKSKF